MTGRLTFRPPQAVAGYSTSRRRSRPPMHTEWNFEPLVPRSISLASGSAVYVGAASASPATRTESWRRPAHGPCACSPAGIPANDAVGPATRVFTGLLHRGQVVRYAHTAQGNLPRPPRRLVERGSFPSSPEAY